MTIKELLEIYDNNSLNTIWINGVAIPDNCRVIDFYDCSLIGIQVVPFVQEQQGTMLQDFSIIKRLDNAETLIEELDYLSTTFPTFNIVLKHVLNLNIEWSEYNNVCKRRN